jgi:hypothetical protein
VEIQYRKVPGSTIQPGIYLVAGTTPMGPMTAATRQSDGDPVRYPIVELILGVGLLAAYGTGTANDTVSVSVDPAYIAAFRSNFPPTRITSSGLVAATVVYGQVTAGGAGIALTLQSTLLAVGQAQRFMKMDAAAGHATFTDSASKTFNGASSYVLTSRWQGVEFVWDGTQYTVFD